MNLAEATSPEATRARLVLVPVGSIEQHGPHLPLDTDTVIADAVAHEVAMALCDDGVWVAPPLAYGSSGEHQSFPGTCSIGTPVLHAVVIELVRSIATWAGSIVFINAHGGNALALERAVNQMRDEGHDVAWVPCATEEVDLHAGFTETSLMLLLRPFSVRLDRAESGNTAPLAELLPRMMEGGIAAVSANGVLGDPVGASASDGRRVLHEVVDKIVSALDERARP